jgi:hypothetical protein
MEKYVKLHEKNEVLRLFPSQMKGHLSSRIITKSFYYFIIELIDQINEKLCYKMKIFNHMKTFSGKLKQIYLKIVKKKFIKREIC